MADAYLFAIDFAELAARGRLDLLRAMVPTRVADFRLLTEAQATFHADFAVALAGGPKRSFLNDLGVAAGGSQRS